MIQENMMLGMKQRNEKQNKRDTIEFFPIINKTLLNHSESQMHDAEKSIDCWLCNSVLLWDLRMANDKALIKEVEVR